MLLATGDRRSAPWLKRLSFTISLEIRRTDFLMRHIHAVRTTRAHGCGMAEMGQTGGWSLGYPQTCGSKLTSEAGRELVSSLADGIRER